MELRPGLALQSVIKAMTDVVLPAVDPDNKLAQEQSRLVIGVLALLAERLPLLYRFERDELSRFLALAAELGAQAAQVPAAGAALEPLRSAVTSAADVLERARAEPAELEAANLQLRDHLGALVGLLYTHADEARRKTIGGIVTAHAREQLLRERAWHVKQGWESEPHALPAIESLLP